MSIEHEFIPLTDDGEHFTCKLPADESVVEVKLKDGTVRRVLFECFDDGCDFSSVDENDEPIDGESQFDHVVAWRPAAPRGADAPQAREFQVVSVDDWAALYVDRKLVDQGHSISLNSVASAGAGQPFILRGTIGADGTALQEWAHENGVLPDTLDEALAIMGDERR